MKRDPVWKTPQWYGSCGKCAMTAALSTKESFLNKLVDRDKTWQGGTIQIPFKPR